MHSAELAPRRLILHIDQLEALRQLARAAQLPADFRVTAGDPAAAAAAPDPLSSLVERGLATDSEPGCLVMHAVLAANLRVLSAPEVLIEIRAFVGEEQALRAAHAVTGSLGASLVRAEVGAGVELSLFSAERLGEELRRVIPECGAGPAAAPPPTGAVPLAALVELPTAAGLSGPEVVAQIADDLRVTPQERELAVSLSRRTTGVLQAFVMVPARGRGEVWIGEVLWYATDGGWVGLAPEPDLEGRTVARLVAVQPRDLGGWVAPLVGQALVEAAR